MHCDVYSDLLFASTVSRKGNWFALIFATNIDLSCMFPMKLKSEAHEALSFLFQKDGLLLAIMFDNSKKMILVS